MKMRENGLGRKWSDERRAKASVSLRKVWASKTPEQRKVGHQQTPEMIERRRAAIVAGYARKRALQE